MSEVLHVSTVLNQCVFMKPVCKELAAEKQNKSEYTCFNVVSSMIMQVC